MRQRVQSQPAGRVTDQSSGGAWQRRKTSRQHFCAMVGDGVEVRRVTPLGARVLRCEAKHADQAGDQRVVLSGAKVADRSSDRRGLVALRILRLIAPDDHGASQPAEDRRGQLHECALALARRQQAKSALDLRAERSPALLDEQLRTHRAQGAMLSGVDSRSQGRQRCELAGGAFRCRAQGRRPRRVAALEPPPAEATLCVLVVEQVHQPTRWLARRRVLGPVGEGGGGVVAPQLGLSGLGALGPRANAIANSMARLTASIRPARRGCGGHARKRGDRGDRRQWRGASAPAAARSRAARPAARR